MVMAGLPAEPGGSSRRGGRRASRIPRAIAAGAFDPADRFGRELALQGRSPGGSRPGAVAARPPVGEVASVGAWRRRWRTGCPGVCDDPDADPARDLRRTGPAPRSVPAADPALSPGRSNPRAGRPNAWIARFRTIQSRLARGPPTPSAIGWPAGASARWPSRAWPSSSPRPRPGDRRRGPEARHGARGGPPRGRREPGPSSFPPRLVGPRRRSFEIHALRRIV